MTIYLDNSATTRPYDEVTEVVAETMREHYGNPSSLHRMGLEAEKILRGSRESLAAALAVSPGEVIFTGSGTEADNIALLGGARALKRKGKRIITDGIEHPAVLETFRALEQEGFETVFLGVDDHGRIDPDEVKAALTEDTVLVSMMHVNNELGTIQPVEEVGGILKEREKLYFHVDAVQSFGKLPMKPVTDIADLVAVSAHKIHGPKGMGALYIRKGTNLRSPVTGGGQERGLRSGTENVPGIAGFGKAAEITCGDLAGRTAAIRKVRDYLMKGIKDQIEDIRINSFEDERCVCSVLNVSFPGVRGEVLLHMLEQKEIYVSTGSACSSHKKGQSHVLKAAGLSDEEIEGAIRFSFSAFNTTEEMDIVLDCLKTSVAQIRKITRRR